MSEERSRSMQRGKAEVKLVCCRGDQALKKKKSLCFEASKAEDRGMQSVDKWRPARQGGGQGARRKERKVMSEGLCASAPCPHVDIQCNYKPKSGYPVVTAAARASRYIKMQAHETPNQ